MEGQEVGSQGATGAGINNQNLAMPQMSGQAANPMQGSAQTSEVNYFGDPATAGAKKFVDPAKKQLAPLSKDERELLSLLWPNNLIHELSESQARSRWATPVMLIGFVLVSILAFLLGPVQLLVQAFSGDYLMTTELFFPVALKISMITSGVIAILTIVALIQTWREQSKYSLTNVVLGFGIGVITFLIWLMAFGVKLRPYQATILLMLVFIATLIGAVITRKNHYETEQKHLALHSLLIVAVALVAIEIVFDATFVMIDIANREHVQTEIEQIGAAQGLARTESVSDGLSDLVFTLCNSQYDVVYQSEELPDTGIFECKTSHDVYVVSGPLEAQVEYKTNSVVTGSAFYLGTTDSVLVSQYFPSESGVRYLYRELKERTEPSELVLLVPAGDEQSTVASVVDPLTNLINAHASQNQDLRISIFYNPELNSVYNTRDFIIMAAADTIALNDYLLNGNSLTGYVNGRSGTYIYRPDTELKALVDLGAKPLLYSAQTRNAITANRHITFVAEKNREYSAEEVVNMMFASFFAPFTNPDQLESVPEE